MLKTFDEIKDMPVGYDPVLNQAIDFASWMVWY